MLIFLLYARTHNKSVRKISYILLEELVKKKKQQFIKEKNEQEPMLNSGQLFKFKICLSRKMSFSAYQASIDYKMGTLIYCW